MGQDIIGRAHQKAALERLLKSSKSEFLVMYGRRRVGKTFLIREYYQRELFFSCSGINTGLQDDQLDAFYEALLDAGYKKNIVPNSWMEAFRTLKQIISKKRSKKKKVIFLDEASWLDTQRSKFIHALGHFWNTFCSARTDIILVICGSVSSWMQANIIDNKGELHNRKTKQIRLLPFSLYETERYLSTNRVSLNMKDIIMLYMVFGGIPYYLDMIEPGNTVPQIIDKLLFNEDAALKGEYDNLYSALFRRPEKHIKIIDALSKKNKGLTRKEILKSTRLHSGGTFSKVLNELEECGFVRRIQPIDKTSEDVLYRLMDEYSIFYHKYIRRGNISSGEALANSRTFNIWAGFAFENLCIRHVKHITTALGISGTDYRIYSYKDKTKDQSKGAQIDLIIDRPTAVNICEAKFYNDVYRLTKSEASKITKRVNSYAEKTKTKKSIFKTLVSVYGAEKNQHYLSVITNEVVGKDLFKDIAL